MSLFSAPNALILSISQSGVYCSFNVARKTRPCTFNVNRCHSTNSVTWPFERRCCLSCRSDVGPEVGFEATGIVDSKLPTVGVWARKTSEVSVQIMYQVPPVELGCS